MDQANADSSGTWKLFRGAEPQTLQNKDSLEVNTSMYEIKTAGAKGLGVFATTFIPRGTRIFSERPLLAIKAGQDAGDLYTSSRCLSLQDQQRLMRLSFHVNNELRIIRWSHALWYTLKGLTRSKISASTAKGRQSIFDHVAVLNIFRSNSFNIGSRGISQALFSRISRINHSCIPNAQGNYHEEQGRFNVHATRDINIDEEVSINYLPENGFVKSSRQDQLLSGYGFSCNCPACDMANLSAQKGEADRVKFHENLGNAREELGSPGGYSTETELSMTRSFIELLEGQKITGRELSSL